MNYKFYLNSEKAWGAMLDAVKNAQKSIFLEMYIFADNTEKYDFFGALNEKAKDGLKVKVIIDAFYGHGLPKKTLEDAKKSGVEILFFSHWIFRTHRKILIVDDEVAFLGGVNIHKIFRKWEDLQVCLRGKIVKSILKSFAKSYRTCGGKDEEVLVWGNGKFLRKIKTQIVERWDGKVSFSLKRYYKNRFEKAQKSIEIATPYFAPSRWFANAMVDASSRGVNVEIVIPQETDNWFSDRASYFYMYKFHSPNIKFYIFPRMNHAKVILIDKLEGMVGSPNIDILSLEYNAEIGVFFQQKEMVDDLSKIVEGWKEQCLSFSPMTHKPKWFDYLLSPLFRLVYRMF